MRTKKYNRDEAIQLLKKGKVTAMYEYYTGHVLSRYDATKPRFKGIKDNTVWVTKVENTKYRRNRIKKDRKYKELTKQKHLLLDKMFKQARQNNLTKLISLRRQLDKLKGGLR